MTNALDKQKVMEWIEQVISTYSQKSDAATTDADKIVFPSMEVLTVAIGIELRSSRFDIPEPTTAELVAMLRERDGVTVIETRPEQMGCYWKISAEGVAEYNELGEIGEVVGYDQMITLVISQEPAP